MGACRRCHLVEHSIYVVLPTGTGPLLLVAEQPGEQEDVVGEPLQGPAGEYLRHLLRKAGFTPNEFVATYLVKCFSPARVEAYQKCRFWLDQEIIRYQPRLIVALGERVA